MFTHRAGNALAFHLVAQSLHGQFARFPRPLFLHGQHLPQSHRARGVSITPEGHRWAHRVRVDSAGTHNYHPGSAPDPRSQRHALARGWDLSDLRARQLQPLDFEQADLLLGMDWDNMALAEAQCPPEYRHKLRRFTEFCLRHTDTVVPDPYYTGAAGFEHVLDLVEDASEGLLRHVEQVLRQRGVAP
jgi:protein-tyrosine phosphatase